MSTQKSGCVAKFKGCAPKTFPEQLALDKCMKAVYDWLTNIPDAVLTPNAAAWLIDAGNAIRQQITNGVTECEKARDQVPAAEQGKAEVRVALATQGVSGSSALHPESKDSNKTRAARLSVNFTPGSAPPADIPCPPASWLLNHKIASSVTTFSPGALVNGIKNWRFIPSENYAQSYLASILNAGACGPISAGSAFSAITQAFKPDIQAVISGTYGASKEYEVPPNIAVESPPATIQTEWRFVGDWPEQDVTIPVGIAYWSPAGVFQNGIHQMLCTLKKKGPAISADLGVIATVDIPGISDPFSNEWWDDDSGIASIVGQYHFTVSMLGMPDFNVAMSDSVIHRSESVSVSSGITTWSPSFSPMGQFPMIIFSWQVIDPGPDENGYPQPLYATSFALNLI